ASAVLPRERGRDTRTRCWAGRALRGRGAAEEGLLARPERPSRCTLPMTALRVTFPSSAAIWLAESPASQSFFSCSTRSSDQVSTVIALFPSHGASPSGGAPRCQIRKKPLQAESLVRIPYSESPIQNPLTLAERAFTRPNVTPDT